MPPLRTLEGRVAVVTGGSRGIGKGIAIELAKRGAKVAINYASSSSATEDTLQELKAFGADVIAVRGDVTKLEDVERVFGETLEAFGKVDIVCSNSGVESFDEATGVTPEKFDQVFAINARAQFFVAVTGYRYMTELSNPPCPNGRIILTSSIAARILGVKNHALYAGSKSAVEGITRSLATDFGPKGVTVNAIAPGGVKTDMFSEAAKNYVPGGLEKEMTVEEIEDGLAKATPLGRVAVPKDIGNVVAWLAGEDSEWVTGQVILCSGGSPF